jgi:AraC family transcriptional regulator of adaptative response/methylated-DNA-[protein]-cysteine methyltransferase
MSPASYRRGGAGATIRYGTAVCPFGWVLVAATERGVCAVSLGDDEAAVGQALRAEFPRATVARDDLAVRVHLDAVLAHLNGRSSLAAVQMDVPATPFQGRVWEALRAIPPGERRRYGDVAAALGDPGAARAVASACAGNPVAIVIPCQRVVRDDGGAGGYRWGLGRKEALLAAEREDATLLV